MDTLELRITSVIGFEVVIVRLYDNYLCIPNLRFISKLFVFPEDVVLFNDNKAGKKCWQFFLVSNKIL